MASHLPTAWTVVVIATTTLISGCSKPLTLEERVDKAGTLPVIRSSGHSNLRSEFRLIEQSHGLPEELASEEVPAHQNAAIALARSINMESADKINESAEALLSAAATPEQDTKFLVAEARKFRSRWGDELAGVRDASKLPRCNFELDLKLGRFADLGFIKRATAASRLLLVDCLHDLDQSPSHAYQSFEPAWRWIDHLMETRHLESWLAASTLRTEALGVVSRMANHPDATSDDLVVLKKLLTRSFGRWPSVQSALLRERAIDLHSYEAIRLELAPLLFTSEEQKQMRTEGVWSEVIYMPDSRIDADEAAYLEYMREVIEAAAKPFYLCKQELVESDQKLEAHPNQKNYHWYANKVFADNLTLAQAELARDRARVEAWVVVLARATNTELPPAIKLNPFTGQEYDVRQLDDRYVVFLDDNHIYDPSVPVR